MATKAKKTKAPSTSVPALQGEEFILTREGLRALEEELEDLKTRGRREVASRLKEAISYGDLSENSEYEEAKNQQAFMEGRIIELEQKIKEAKVVDESQHSRKVVEIGTRVVICKVGSKKEMEITIVGATEADPFNDRVSNEAPVGMALMGSKVGDVVVVHAPQGNESYEVIKLA